MLVDDFKCVLAPVFDVDQGVVQRGAVVACEGIAFTQHTCGAKHVSGDDFVQQPPKFRVGERDVIECVELFAEVVFKSCAVPDVGAVCVFQPDELLQKLFFHLLFCCVQRWDSSSMRHYEPVRNGNRPAISEVGCYARGRPL